MIIKKFTAKTESEAIEAAKKELGDGIVIMNTRSVKKKGLFSIFRRQMKEVTVALEEEEMKESKAKEDDELRQAVAKVSRIAREAENDREREKEKQQEDSPARRRSASAVYEAGKSGGYTEEAVREKQSVRPTLQERDLDRRQQDNESFDRRLESLQELLERQIAAPIQQAAAMSEAMPQTEGEDSNIAFFQLLYQMMVENEVDDEYAAALIDDMADVVKPNTPLDHLLATVYQRLVLKFGEAETIAPAARGPKVIFFIGPTGVGKTTTIAKLASSFKVEQKKRIALLTADTYRIAAAEQLRTYANILEVPFRIIYTPAELRSAIRDFDQCDYIMVDTAGHSPHNTSQKDGMADLLGALDFSVEKEVYLVVSATTKYRDLKSIADSYKGMTDFSLIFTKVDETTTLGSILNLRLYTGAPLAYITIGQNVPDDIEIFNAQETVKLLLSGQNELVDR